MAYIYIYSQTDALNIVRIHNRIQSCAEWTEQNGTSSCLYNHDRFNALTETEKEKWAAVSAVTWPRSCELSDAHQTRSIHSLTKLLNSLLVFKCVIDRTSLDWAHLFKNRLSAVMKLNGVMMLSCPDAVVTSAVHSYTDMYSIRCFNLLNE